MKLEEEIQQKSFPSEYHKLVPNLVFTSSWALNNVSAMLKDYDLTAQQFNLLRILRGQHPTPASVNSLIARMLDKQSNASRLIDKLKLKGLVTRRECPSDRRAVDVSITEKGLKVLQEIDKEEQKMQSVLHTLTAAEAKTLNALLDKLRG